MASSEPRTSPPFRPPTPAGGEAAEWFSANRTGLDQAFNRLRAALESRLTGDGTAPTAEPVSLPPALDRLALLFNLSSFESSIILLCAAYALDGRIGPLLAAAQGDPARAWPTFGIALSLFPAAHWDALTPAGRLRRWRLVEVIGEGELTASRIALDERVLHYVMGAFYLDARLSGLVIPVDCTRPPGTMERREGARVAAAWRAAAIASGSPVVEISAITGTAARDIAAAGAAILGIALHEVRAEELPRTIADRDQLQRLWAREALLAHSALYVDARDLEPGDAGKMLAPFLEGLPALVAVGTRAPLLRLSRSCERIPVSPPGAGEQLAMWRSALGPLADRLNGELDAVACQFRLAPAEIASAGARAAEQAGAEDALAFAAGLWSACRDQARGGLEQLAERTDVRAGWDALVLPRPQLDALRLITLHVRHRTKVYDRWGFASIDSRGLGIGALFAGPSGTGKTLAAEILAKELALDLYRIDLAAVVSKYIGETEKNLRRIFDAADASGAILLFDEADALFGKRSEVRDSHDRYANIEVSYLLQRIETYRGLAILTTNFREAIDPAFLRRIRFVVHFPFPDAKQRRDIWRRIFPTALPKGELDLDRLSCLNLSGGSIRNVALHAAFLAAEKDAPIGMAHLRLAAEAEYAKLEKPLHEAELGEAS